MQTLHIRGMDFLVSVRFQIRFENHLSLESVWYNFALLFGLISELVRRSGRGTVHWRPCKIFLHFHQLWTILSKIREGVALSPLSIFL